MRVNRLRLAMGILGILVLLSGYLYSNSGGNFVLSVVAVVAGFALIIEACWPD